MSTEPNNEDNKKLAEACWKTCSSCCNKGKIFLPPEQRDKIVGWMKENSPKDLIEFSERLEEFDGFSLYDQRTGCQFLDEKHLCRLHNDNVKPRECFWWPLHVYVNKEDELEIGAATTCCEAYKHLTPDSAYIQDITDDLKAIGGDLIRKFRKVFPGTYPHLILKKFSK